MQNWSNEYKTLYTFKTSYKILLNTFKNKDNFKKMEWEGTWYCLALMYQVLLTHHERPYPSGGVDGAGWGKVQGSRRRRGRGYCGWYVK